MTGFPTLAIDLANFYTAGGVILTALVGIWVFKKVRQQIR